MPRILLSTPITAPPSRVFDLARSIDLHVASTARSKERAVAGRTAGLIGLGEAVTWEARHLGVRQRLSSRITAFEPPHRFVDEMTEGAFASLWHEHVFAPDGRGGTVTVDDFHFVSPLGPLGRLADALVLRRYMERLLRGRAAAIKQAAETEAWKQYVPG